MSGRSSSRPSRASSSTRSARHRRRTGRPFSPQTRDMNPIYTGKDVSFIDTKQAQRIAENTLLGCREVRHDRGPPRCPVPDRGDRQGVAAAAVRRPSRRDHRLRVGPGLPRSPRRLARGGRARQDASSTARSTTSAPRSTPPATGRAITVFNALSWPRTDIARVEIDAARRRRRPGSSSGTTPASVVPFAARGRRPSARTGRRPARPSRSSRRDVPALGYRTFRAVPSATPLDESGWRADRHAGHRERRLRRVGRSSPRRRHRQPRRQALRARSSSDR